MIQIAKLSNHNFVKQTKTVMLSESAACASDLPVRCGRSFLSPCTRRTRAARVCGAERAERGARVPCDPRGGSEGREGWRGLARAGRAAGDAEGEADRRPPLVVVSFIVTKRPPWRSPRAPKRNSRNTNRTSTMASLPRWTLDISVRYTTGSRSRCSHERDHLPHVSRGRVG